MQVLSETDNVMNVNHVNNDHFILIQNGSKTFLLLRTTVEDDPYISLYSFSNGVQYPIDTLGTSGFYDDMNNKMLCKECIDNGYTVHAFDTWKEITHFLNT